jgi:hypothetical protein
MKWSNPGKELPKKNIKVIVKHNDTLKLASYSRKTRGFLLENGFFLPCSTSGLVWTEYKAAKAAIV